MGDSLAFLGNLFVPADCALCGVALKDFSRVPVCSSCLVPPEPLTADHFCVQCRTPFLNDAPLDQTGRCRLCRAGLLGFDAVYSYGEYTGALRRLIHLLKYQRVQSLARPMASWLSQALPRDERIDLVVPVPMHWTRLYQRGFNQAALLTAELARRTGFTHAPRALRRPRRSVPQARLTGAQRRRNARNAFAARRPEQIAGKSILLVDDVFTTGATLAACARELKRAGARRVVVLTLARVDRRPQLEPYLRTRARGAA